ncbi:hypothetical protein LUZ60_002789 [Juncus effusus]|nr:hypothetical protein LUZ60_002789 [Juncus effusus]
MLITARSVLLLPLTPSLAASPCLASSLSARNGAWIDSRNRARSVGGRRPCAVVSSAGAASREGISDPELRWVLDLASHEELLEIQDILFGTSYFSPLLKSITKSAETYYFLDLDDVAEREIFISHLESRFLFLAADARSVIRGWRPTYRRVLFEVCKKLSIKCSRKLTTQDLEVEIFLHLLGEYSSETNPSFGSSNSSLENGLSTWKVQSDSALRVGAEGFKNILLKGGGALTMEKIYELLAKRFSGKLLTEAANYEIKKEIIKRGGQLAAINLESKAGLLAARQGLAHAASRYLGLRSLMTLVGPLMWGTFLADVVIQMLGTDYARIIRAIYAFAQIRLTRTNGWRHKPDA